MIPVVYSGKLHNKTFEIFKYRQELTISVYVLKRLSDRICFLKLSFLNFLCLEKCRVLFTVFV